MCDLHVAALRLKLQDLPTYQLSVGIQPHASTATRQSTAAVLQHVLKLPCWSCMLSQSVLTLLPAARIGAFARPACAPCTCPGFPCAHLVQVSLHELKDHIDVLEVAWAGWQHDVLDLHNVCRTGAG